METLASDAGAGRVLIDDASPKAFADPIEFETAYKPLLEKAGVACERRDGFSMRRGDYVIAYALNEKFAMGGTFVDVFSPDLAAYENPEVTAGTCGLFKSFDPAAEPAVWVMLVSRTESRRLKIAKNEKPSTAETIEAPNVQPIFKPM